MKRATPEESSPNASNNSNNSNNGSKKVKRSHPNSQSSDNLIIFDSFASMLKSIPMEEIHHHHQLVSSSMELASPSSLRYKTSSLLIT